MTGQARFAAVGDIYLGGLVAGAMASRGPDFTFQRVAPLLREYDLTFGNLEGPLTREGFIEKAGPGWRAQPDVAPALRDAGFHVLNLSNNHIGDCGNAGITDTLAALGAVGIQNIGVGRSMAEARIPVIVERNGVRTGLLGYCDSYLARGGSFGGAPIRENLIAADIARLRDRVHCVIVSLHHGIEYSDFPEPRVVTLCRALVDCGAGIVLGHHPHVIQGWEQYRNGVIVHSLGNFVADFGDPGEKLAAFERSILVNRGLLKADLADTRTEESVVFTCDLTASGPRDCAFVPIVIDAAFQPCPVDGERGASILARLDRISQALADPSLPVFRQLEQVGLVVALQRARPSLDILRRLHRVRPRHATVLMRYVFSLLHRAA